MTAMTTATRPPVPYADRLDFEARLRAVATNQPASVNETCTAARDIAAGFPWADTRTVANALVDVLGTGWGALYLHWEVQEADRA